MATVFFFFAVMLFSSGCSNSGGDDFDPAKPSAKIIKLDGEVQYKKTGSEGWSQAIINQMMLPYQLLRALNESEKKGSAVLAFIDNTRLSLEPGAILEISKITKNSENQGFFDISLKVLTGLTLFEVEHHGEKREFLVETESAVTAVTGTVFSVEVKPDGSTRVVVKEGQVDVTGKGSRVSVKASMATVVKKGETPAAPATINLKGETIFDKNLRDVGTLKR